MERTRISLNGTWVWTRKGHPPTAIQVPSSYHPVGSALFEREFTVDGVEGRWFLIFEGIAYHATVKVNGKAIGKPMLPYSHYELDVTGAVRAGANQLAVQVDDTRVPFGPNAGWEQWGGIIRDVYLEQRDELHIAAARFQTTFDQGLATADCTLALTFSRDLPAGASVTVTLTERDTRRITGAWELPTTGSADTLALQMDNPRLWCPDSPVLYDLQVDLRAAGRVADSWQHRVGFREIRCEGRHIEINGKPIFLKGVLRHDFWHEQGYTLTREQMRTDIELIKEMGCNFIRQIHYPHHPYLADLADEYGLLITGESGIWWHDLNDPKQTEPAMQILERLVRRDWNHPSIIAWLFGNESTLRQPFVSDAAARFRALDPGRLVSFASCDSNENIKRFFTEADLDFYTQHPYSFTPDAAQKAIDLLDDRPLILTEWGGYLVRENEQCFGEFKRAFVRAWREGRLAGIAYCAFADFRQYSRGWPPCRKAALIDGLVDERRVKRPEYMMMQQLFRALDEDEPGLPLDPPQRFAPYVCADPQSTFTPVDLAVGLATAGQAALWGAMHEAAKRVWRWIEPRLRPEDFPDGPSVGPIPFVLPTDGRPLCVGEALPKVFIPVNRQARRIHFLGQVTTLAGYPVEGEWGAPVARYGIGVKGRRAIVRTLKHGEDVVRGDLVWSATRMDPRSVNAPVVLRWWLDTEYGYCQVALLTLELRPAPAEVTSLTFECLDESFFTLLYAVTTEA